MQHCHGDAGRSGGRLGAGVSVMGGGRRTHLKGGGSLSLLEQPPM